MMTSYGTANGNGRHTAGRGHTLTAHAIARHAPLWCDGCWPSTESETP